MRKKICVHIVVVFFLILQGCGGGKTIKQIESDGAPVGDIDLSEIKNAQPKQEPRSRYGNPESYVVFGERYHVMDEAVGYSESGIASWYGTKFHGRRTSSGETYDMYAMTAAHKSLPLPTYVEVTNLENGRAVIVKVNDRGPFHDNRIIDMSFAAANKLGMVGAGTALVNVRAIQPDHGPDEYSRPQYVSHEEERSLYESDNRFYIQVGAFSELMNAENLRERLDDIEGQAVSIRHDVIDNMTIYKVLIGPINNIDLADRIVALLPRYNVTDHNIVAD